MSQLSSFQPSEQAMNADVPPMLYFDHAATTPLSQTALNAMLPWLEGGNRSCGNPSSLHTLGQQAKQAIDGARQSIQHDLGISDGRVVFTSGATESINTVIRGLIEQWCMDRPGEMPHLILSSIEHEAALEIAQYFQRQKWSELTLLPVDEWGRVSPEALKQAIQPNTALVSIIWGNNETGVLQDVASLGQICREAKVPFHVDAVQVIGKHPVEFDSPALKTVDFASWSAHKCYGPKGVGGLYISNSAPPFKPFLWGGGQEGNQRSGTENVAGIVGMAASLREATEQLDMRRNTLIHLEQTLRHSLKDAFKPLIERGVVQLYFNSEASKSESKSKSEPELESNLKSSVERVPGIVHVSIAPTTPNTYLQGEAMVLRLNLMGIAASSGSACHSAVIEPSRILRALMGKLEGALTPVEYARAMGTIRFSLSHTQTPEQMEQAANALVKVAEKLVRKPMPYDGAVLVTAEA